VRGAPLLRLLFAGCLLACCAPSRPAIRNVLLISIDTLRADHVSSYGFPRPTTPNIDSLAREGVLFRSVRTPAPVTLPAHCSMLTGTLPPTHGVRDNLNRRLPDSSETLAELLKAKGLATGAVVSSFVLDRRFNLSQGFDSYDDRFQALHKIGDIAERKGDETTARATEWLAAHAQTPFFLFVHYYDPHEPYSPPAPFDAQWKDDAYAGEVAFADQGVGRVLEKLKQLGVYEQTLIVVTGDHGEMLGEHGEADHGFFLYEGALNVPLILRVPGAQAARRVDLPVSLLDVVPTIAALTGAPTPKQAQGQDLSPLLLGTTARVEPKPLYAETFTAARHYGASPLLAVIADGWKYIETTRPELYDLRNDPKEASDLAAKETGRAAVLAKGLKSTLSAAVQRAAAGESAGLDEEARQRLESLGYLSRGDGGAAEFDRSKEDPKDLIGFYRSDQRLSKLVDEKKYAEARVLCDTMLRQRPGFADCHLQMSRIALAEGDAEAARAAAARAVAVAPQNARARLHLGNLLKSRGDLDAAITEYRRALAAEPESPEARRLLGRALADKGQTDEAVALLRGASAAQPESAQSAVQLGFALARQGKLDDAITHYQRALTLEPGSAEAQAYLGSALANQGKLDEAIAHFELALRARPEHAELHDWMGMALREKGRSDEAFAHFREAASLDPRLASAQLNLGRAYKQQGKTDDAVRHLRAALAREPRLAAAHNSLGSILGAQGRVAEAIGEFRAALEAEPKNAEAHNNLGLALRMSGRGGEAVPHFKAALAARSDWPAPMNELAWILATHPDARVRDAAEAVRLAERAAALSQRREPVVLDTLGAAYAEAGDFGRATAAAEAALQTAPSALKGEIARRLQLYRGGQPYRERTR
jgi:arylsulfatase A-like enzyme/Flp pilus assembly protein TadD